MGNKSAFAYDVGVGLGLASYQASVGQAGRARAALADARPSAKRLVVTYKILAQARFDDGFNGGVAHSHLAIARQEIETDIGDHSVTVANAYHLGLLLALAEGQSSSDGAWPDARPLAQDALKQANKLVSEHLGSVPFKRELMNKALQSTANVTSSQAGARKAISNLRITYREQVLRSVHP